MGIPLAALAIRQPEDPLEQYGRALAIKGALQNQAYQAQAQPLELQQRQQQTQQGALQLADQKAMTSALQSWDGKDIEDLPGMVLKHGGSAQAVFGLKNQIIEQRKNLAAADEATLKNESTKNDLIAGHIEAMKGAPDKQQAYQSMVSDLQQKGLAKPGQLPPQYPGDDQLDLLEKGLIGQKQLVEQAQKDRESKARELTAQTGAERLKAEMPGGPLADVSRAEMQDWLAKNPGKGPSDYVAWKAKQAPLAQINVANAAGGGLSSTAQDQAAEKYWQTGQLPPTARGVAGLAQNRAIMNRAAELHPEGNLAANSAEYHANSASLNKLQTNFDQVNAFENTAIKNLDQVARTGALVPDLGTRFANVPVRKITGDMLGTKEMAQFRTALLTAQAESAKVLNSANAQGILTNEARKEAQNVLDGNLPFPAMLASINQLKTDFGNRHQSYLEQIADIKSRISGKPNSTTPSTTPAGYKPLPSYKDWDAKRKAQTNP